MYCSASPLILLPSTFASLPLSCSKGQFCCCVLRLLSAHYQVKCHGGRQTISQLGHQFRFAGYVLKYCLAPLFWVRSPLRRGSHQLAMIYHRSSLLSDLPAFGWILGGFWMYRKFIIHLPNTFGESTEHLPNIYRKLLHNCRTSIDNLSMMRAMLLSNVLHVDRVEDESTHDRHHEEGRVGFSMCRT